MRLRHLILLSTAASLVAAAMPAGSEPCALPDTPRFAPADPASAACGISVVGGLDVSLDGGTGQVAVHGDLAAVIQRDEGLVTLVDLSDPTAPARLGSYDGGTGVASLDDPLDGDVAFSDDGQVLLYARQTSGSSNEGLHVLDVSDPTAPVLTDLNAQGGMLRVTYGRVAGRELVVTMDAINGMTIFELVRTPLGAKVVTLHVDALPQLKVGGPASAGLVLVEETATLYVTDGTTGLRVLDLSQPALPVELGAWDVQGLAEIVLDQREDSVLLHAAAEYWFDDTTLPELITLDVSDPAAIVEVSRRNLGGYDGSLAWKIGGMHLDAEGLWIAHGHAGLLRIDPDTGVVERATTELGEVRFPSSHYGPLGWYAMDVTPYGDLMVATDAVTGELRVLAPHSD